MRYVVDVPATWNRQLAVLASEEGVAPRILILWLLKCELERLKPAPKPAEQAA
jgi:hypothetical protein